MKTRKTNAFYIEAVIMTFFILALSAVLLQLFTSAWKISEKSRQGTDAVLIAQNASEQFCSLLSRGNAPQQAADKMNAIKTENEYEILYSSDGLISQAGEYTAVISTHTKNTSAGSLHTVTVSVYTQNQRKQAIFELAASRYVNG